MFKMSRNDVLLMVAFIAVVLLMPVWTKPIGAAYPDLLQKFAIFGLFAIGYNILFGLTGYLSFGHAAFLGVGSYTTVWTFKLLSLNVIPAVVLGTLMAGVFAVAIGYICLRRTGIYFAILTLAFAQMSYNMAYSVLTPITNGETGLRVLRDDPMVLDRWLGSVTQGSPVGTLLGFEMQGYPGFYFCAAVLIVGFYISLMIFRSPFGLKLKAIKTNQSRMRYTGYNTRPYVLLSFVVSAMYAGMAGSLLAVTDPLAGAERMQWTASGEVVLMTILGGAGTLLGPLLGAALIKYFENIFSAFNESALHEAFSFMPEAVENILVYIVQPFVGEGWHLTLGALFMAIVIFMPGGLMEGLSRLFKRRQAKKSASGADEQTGTGG